MNLKKLNPWNWFKHEEAEHGKAEIIPVKREDYAMPEYPITNLGQLHCEIDRLFEDTFRSFGMPSTLSKSSLWNKMINEDFMPAFKAKVNVASDDKQYTITLEAPGLEQKDLSLELHDNVLRIKGNKQEEKEDKDKHYYRIERSYGSFERVLAVPDDGDTDGINAKLDKGVLTISIPRKESPADKVKTIDIKAS